MSFRHLSLVAITVNLIPIAIMSQARAQEVRWRESYSAAYQESQRTGRPLLMKFGTEACFWCQKLEATTMRVPQVAKLINEKFIPVKIDARVEADLANAVAVQSFPTMFVLAPDRTILTRYEGYGEATEILGFLNDGLAKAPTPKADLIANAAKNSKKPGPFRVTGREPGDKLDAEATAARGLRASRMLAQAQKDFAGGLFLAALERSRAIVNDFANTNEAAEAQKLINRIGGDRDRLQAISADVGAGLADLYRKLADDADRAGQTDAAEEYRQQASKLADVLGAKK